MSPEIRQNKVPFYGYAIETWAVGVILFIMCTGYMTPGKCHVIGERNFITLQEIIGQR